MSKDIYGAETTVGGAWALEGIIIVIEGAEDLVVTSMSLNYARPINKFMPLNSKSRFLVTGEAEGQAQLGAIIGPSKSIATFLTEYSDPCKVADHNLVLKPAGVKACDGGGNNAVTFTCKGVLLSSVNLSVQQAGNAITVVNAGMTFSFLSLEVK